MKKELNVLFSIYIYKYIYLNISIFMYWKKEQGLGMHFFQTNAMFCLLLRSFAKECCVLWVLLLSLQKNKTFFAFFYVLSKITLHSWHSFTFLRKARNRMHRSFGFHKSPKTQKKNAKERCVQNVKERGVQPCCWI